MFAIMETKALYVLSEGGEKEPAKHRRQKKPWFRCGKCGALIAQMDVVDGRTCIPTGPKGVTYKVTLTCTRCGREREFVSMPYNSA